MSDKGASTTNGTDAEIKLTPVDSKFFAAFFKNMKSVDIDWEKFTTEMGFKNIAVAKTRYGQIRSKLGLTGPGAGHVGSSGRSSCSRPNRTDNRIIKSRMSVQSKQYKQAPEAADDADDDEEVAVNAQNDEI
ncbi:hypothetical protein F4801DRAFT_234082 [Xylaria longipes]|nr:hypothetical protein F4801DRAFT_234082 [Xylaria longipes]